MTRGSVTKVVSTFGSQWGRIRPAGGSRDIFFRAATFERPAEFALLEVGDEVEFDERPDQVNGTHAACVVLSAPVEAGTAKDS